MDKRIVVIIPAYNENAILRQVVQSLLDCFITHIVVVDDGSSTPVADTIGNLPVTILRHKVNLGQGAALQTGFLYATKLQPDIVITFDADGQHNVQDLPTLIAPIVQQEADIVLGSRFLPASKTAIPFSKKLVLQLARFINLLFSGVLLTDAHNGLRALNQQALLQITITENRMAHASEILFEIQKHRLRYKEVPVHIAYTEYSKGKGQSAWDGIKILFDLALHKLFR